MAWLGAGGVNASRVFYKIEGSRIRVDKQMDKRLSELLFDVKKLCKDATIYLFGSRAKGTARPDSDYDLIIISKKFGRTPFVNRAGLIWRNSDVGIAADLLCYTPSEFAKLSKNSVVLSDALKYAIQV